MTTSPMSGFEASLRSTALPGPSIDRDSLMYQSGYAAAMKQHQRRPLHFASAFGGAAVGSLAASLVLISLSISGESDRDVRITNQAAAKPERVVTNQATDPLSPVQQNVAADGRETNAQLSADATVTAAAPPMLLDAIIDTELARRGSSSPTETQVSNIERRAPIRRDNSVLALSAEAELVSLPEPPRPWIELWQ